MELPPILKPVVFRGSSLGDLRTFPASARHKAGHQLDRVQRGREPDDWKPMPAIGQGVREIRIRDEQGAYRVIYVTKLKDAVYVLHAFQKTTQQTRKSDVDLANARHKDLMRELKR